MKPKAVCDSFEEANDPENLITLCRECHAEKENVDWL
ncbi:HNH endonuclease [Haloplanus halophilus]